SRRVLSAAYSLPFAHLHFLSSSGTRDSSPSFIASSSVEELKFAGPTLYTKSHSAAYFKSFKSTCTSTLTACLTLTTSGVTSKPAIRGHFKCGHGKVPGT